MEEQKSWPRKNPILFIFLISVGIIFLLVSISTGRYSNNAPKEGPAKLNVLVTNNILGITIHNNDTTKWSGCTVRLNGDYKIYADMDPGENLFRYSQFTKYDGTRFNYYATKPYGASVECENPYAEWQL